MPLEGEARKIYMREYMRRWRAGVRNKKADASVDTAALEAQIRERFEREFENRVQAEVARRLRDQPTRVVNTGRVTEVEPIFRALR